MKKFLAISATVLALALPALAQFHPAGPYIVDVLQSQPLTVLAGTITNISTAVNTTNRYAYIGKDGFAATPRFFAASSSTENILLYGTPLIADLTNTAAPTLLGTVTANGTTWVQQSVFTANSTFPGTGQLMLSVTNSGAVNITVSNLWITAW